MGRTAIVQRTDEWRLARRSLITSTDIPAILGLSPYKSEGDIAREKTGDQVEEIDERKARRFRLGLSLEDAIRTEEEAEHGVRLRRVHRLVVHPEIAWAGTSLDFERVGERCIVEAKTSGRDWEDGLPAHYEAQVRWQMGVARYPRVHVAALLFGSELRCFDVEHDEDEFRKMLVVAEDFRLRLALGGPFAETKESARRAYPRDDGETVFADEQTVAAVGDLLRTRTAIADLEKREEALVGAIATRIGTASVVEGPGFRLTYKRSADSEKTEWKEVANALAGFAPAGFADETVAAKTKTVPGTRRFVLKEV